MNRIEKNDSLNIAMLGHKRIPSREGGVEIVVEELSARMVQAGHTVTCLNRSGHHVSGKIFDKKRLKEYKGIKLKTVPTFNRKGLAAMTASVTGAFGAAAGNYDIVHFHAEGPCVMLWLPKLFRKRCVVTIHGLDHRRTKWGKLSSAYIMLGERCAARYADEIIVLSEGVRKYFMDTYGRETKFIPNGVVRPRMVKANLIKKKYGLNGLDFILFLGRIVPEKGLQYLIEAFRTVITDKKLVIAGGSSDTMEFMKKLKKQSAGDRRIIFTGFVEGRLLEELYSNAYIYTLPSDLEGMPISLLEAMSYGNCCLTSDVPECADVIENNAVTFSRGDVKDLAKKLQSLCDSSECVAKYKSIASDYICKKYNWDDVVERTLKLYRKG